MKWDCRVQSTAEKLGTIQIKRGSDMDETHHYGVLHVFPNILDFLFLFPAWKQSTGVRQQLEWQPQQADNHKRYIEVVKSRPCHRQRLQLGYTAMYSDNCRTVTCRPVENRPLGRSMPCKALQQNKSSIALSHPTYHPFTWNSKRWMWYR